MDSSLPLWSLDTINPVLAAGGLAADSLLGWFTNSILVAILVCTVVLLFCRMATRRMELIPGKK
ncbi:MAG: hypothetical protein AAF226_07725, partial [Verrucomicrobiota bacterium]